MGLMIGSTNGGPNLDSTNSPTELLGRNRRRVESDYAEALWQIQWSPAGWGSPNFRVPLSWIGPTIERKSRITGFTDFARSAWR